MSKSNKMSRRGIRVLDDASYIEEFMQPLAETLGCTIKETRVPIYDYYTDSMVKMPVCTVTDGQYEIPDDENTVVCYPSYKALAEITTRESKQTKSYPIIPLQKYKYS